MSKSTALAPPRPSAVALKSLDQIEKIEDALAHPLFIERITAAAVRHMDPERFIRSCALAIQKNEKLAKCRVKTLLGAFMLCAYLGLEPNTPLGLIHLIPRQVRGVKLLGEDGQQVFENGKGLFDENVFDVDIQIDYKGYVELMLRADVQSVQARVVYAADDFKFEYGTNEFLRHVPTGLEDDRTEKLQAYCFIRFKDGTSTFEVQPYWRVLERSRGRSESYKAAVRAQAKADAMKPGKDRDYWQGIANNSPWITDEEEMVAKSLVRRLAKMIRKSPEFAVANQIEGMAEDRKLDIASAIDEAFLRNGVANVKMLERSEEEPADFIEQGMQQEAPPEAEKVETVQQEPPKPQQQRQDGPPPDPPPAEPDDRGPPPQEPPETVSTRMDYTPAELDAQKTRMADNRTRAPRDPPPSPPPPPTAAPKEWIITLVRQKASSSDFEMPRDARAYEAAAEKEMRDCAKLGRPSVEAFYEDNKVMLGWLLKAMPNPYNRLSVLYQKHLDSFNKGDDPGQGSLLPPGR